MENSTKKDTAIRSAESDLGFVDLNTISEEELTNIPWIGKDKARKLIQRRPFANMEAVRRVSRITEDVI
ncbi:MAG: helix-hairpin-helix domain-containing protein, partial [Verrucomicrobiota bacterium]